MQVTQVNRSDQSSHLTGIFARICLSVECLVANPTPLVLKLYVCVCVCVCACVVVYGKKNQSIPVFAKFFGVWFSFSRSDVFHP